MLAQQTPSTAWAVVPQVNRSIKSSATSLHVSASPMIYTGSKCFFAGITGSISVLDHSRCLLRRSLVRPSCQMPARSPVGAPAPHARWTARWSVCDVESFMYVHNAACTVSWVAVVLWYPSPSLGYREPCGESHDAWIELRLLISCYINSGSNSNFTPRWRTVSSSPAL